jgi:hypothetical protein
MGTRGLYVVQSDGQYKIAQYGQWDAYPSGQGVGVCSERLATAEGRADFKAKLGNVKFSNNARELDASRFEREVKDYKPGPTFNQMIKQPYPYAGRDVGSEIFRLVSDSTGTIVTTDSIDFANDSLFCEWAYVIDLDEGTLEVFKGFNEKPLDGYERFTRKRGGNVDEMASAESPRKSYHPIRLAKRYHLDALPTKEAFLNDLTEKDDNR